MFGRWLNKARPPAAPLAVPSPAVNGSASPPGQIVDLRQVVKTYQSEAGDFTALKGVSLQVSPGEFVAVIGKSGSGKSTLINVITGIDRPTSGEVIVAGTPVHALREGQIAPWRGRHLGVIFQFFQLLPTLSLVENVMLPMDFCGMYASGERRQRALHLLDLVGMAEQADKLPGAVSGGQQQRAAIARALANDPPILVADEPTGSLDSKTADSIFELFEDLVRRGKTILMVTHDNDLAHRATRTVIVADGEVINQYVTVALSTLDLDLGVNYHHYAGHARILRLASSTWSASGGNHSPDQPALAIRTSGDA